MSELSQRSDVSVATIKFYLREGLVPPGESVGATRSVYDESHVARLRLIRALTAIAGLSLDQVRPVLAAIDEGAGDPMIAVGIAHLQLSPPPAVPPSDAARRQVARLVRRRRWRTDPDGSHALALASALDTAAAAGGAMTDETLDVYSAAAADVARHDLSSTPRRGAAGATAYAVIGTLINEPILLQLRRMAQENLGRRRIARSG